MYAGRGLGLLVVGALVGVTFGALVDAVLDGVLDGVLDALVDAVLDTLVDAVLDTLVDAVLDTLVDGGSDALVEEVLDMLVDGVLPDAPPRAGVVFVPFVALGTIVAALFGVAAGFLPLRSKSSRSSSQYSSMSKSSNSGSVSISGSGSKSSSSRSSPATSANMRPVIDPVSEVPRAVLVDVRTTASDLTNAACMNPFPNAMVFRNTSGLPMAMRR